MSLQIDQERNGALACFKVTPNLKGSYIKIISKGLKIIPVK